MEYLLVLYLLFPLLCTNSKFCICTIDSTQYTGRCHVFPGRTAILIRLRGYKIFIHSTRHHYLPGSIRINITEHSTLYDFRLAFDIMFLTSSM